MIHARHTAPSRSGFTLMELLIVVFITLAITAIAIPILAPSLDDRRLRESSRMVTTMLAAARSRAIETGRPQGVMFYRFDALPQMTTQMAYAESQAPYSGDFLESRAVVDGAAGGIVFLGDPNDTSILTDDAPDGGWNSLVREGDLIQFNYQGHFYRLDDGVAATATADPYQYFSDPPAWPQDPPTDPPGPWFLSSGTTSLIPTTGPQGIPYQIFRQPVPATGSPAFLPETMVIDLAASGTATEFFAPIDADTVAPDVQDPTAVIIMFAPNGSVDRVYRSRQFTTGGPVLLVGERPSGPIFFLIGQRERIPEPPTPDPVDDPANWQILTNLWVTIQPQSGFVTSTTVAPIDAATTDRTAAITESRLYAVEGQNLGGR
jgi:type II secretory pathway pseudopilin PulG